MLDALLLAFKKTLLILLFGLHRCVVAACGLALAVVSRGYSRAAERGLLLLQRLGSRVGGFQELFLVVSRARAQ